MTAITAGARNRQTRLENACPVTLLRIAVVMDPIEDIKPPKDTTLAMLLAAQRRGWEIALPRTRATCGCATASPWAARTR